MKESGGLDGSPGNVNGENEPGNTHDTKFPCHAERVPGTNPTKSGTQDQDSGPLTEAKQNLDMDKGENSNGHQTHGILETRDKGNPNVIGNVGKAVEAQTISNQQNVERGGSKSVVQTTTNPHQKPQSPERNTIVTAGPHERKENFSANNIVSKELSKDATTEATDLKKSPSLQPAAQPVTESISAASHAVPATGEHRSIGALNSSFPSTKLPVADPTQRVDTGTKLKDAPVPLSEKKQSIPAAAPEFSSATTALTAAKQQPGATPSKPPDLQGSQNTGETSTETETAPLSASEITRRKRAPLVETYAPFIQPNDTSLLAARERLRKALDQTRKLRAAFSDRVYKKYRVLLHPVPKSIDSTIQQIVSDPVAASQRIQDEIKRIKEEKELEKKEAQGVAASLNPKPSIDGSTFGSPVPQASETAEQLAYFGAGLNLVILPEDDVGSEVDQMEYPDRGPINPMTGNRVGGISAAAAAAAETVLDRVRKGNALRVERQRRRQLQLLTGEGSDTMSAAERQSVLSKFKPPERSTGTAKRPAASNVCVPVRALAAPGKAPPVSARKQIFSASSPLSVLDSSGKVVRSRIPAAASGNNLLSIAPKAEDIRGDGHVNASTAALISRNASKSRQANQSPRWRKPPTGPTSPPIVAETLGGITGSASKTDPVPASSSLSNVDESGAASSLAQVDGLAYAHSALHTVLRHFMEPADHSQAVTNTLKPPDVPESVDVNNIHPGNVVSAENKIIHRPTKRRKRQVTEIGLLRDLRLEQGRDGHQPFDVTSQQNPATSVPASTEAEATHGKRKDRADPLLAMSVLYALGIVHEAPNRDSRKMNAEESADIQPTVEGKSNGSASEKQQSPAKTFSESVELSATLFEEEEKGTGKYAPKAPPTSGSVSMKPSKIDDVSSVAEAQSAVVTTSCKVVSKEDLEARVLTSIRGGGDEENGGGGPKSLDNNATQKSGASGDKESAITSKLSKRHIDQFEPTPLAETMKMDIASPLTSASAEPKNLSPSREKSGRKGNGSVGDFSPSMFSHKQSVDSVYPVVPQTGIGFPAGASPTCNDATASRPQISPQPVPPGLVSHQSGSPVLSGFAHHPPAQTHLPHNSLPHGQTLAHPLARSRQASAELNDAYFATTFHNHGQPGYGAGPEWTSFAAAQQAAAGLLPAHTSLASIGLNSHHAAMVSLSVRERAARALLAREQHNVATHAHMQAALAQRHAAALASPQAFIGSPPATQNASGLYTQNSGPTAARFTHLGAHSSASAAVLLSSSANSTNLTKQHDQRPPSASASPPAGSNQKGQPRRQPSSLPLSVPGNKADSASSVAPSEIKGPVSSSGVSTAVDKPGDKPSDADDAGVTSKASTSNATCDGEIQTPDAIDEEPKGDTVTTEKTEQSSEESGVANVTPSCLPKTKVANPPTSRTDGSVIKEEKAIIQEMGSKDAKETSLTPSTAGMRFFVPKPPATLQSILAEKVVEANFHIAAIAISNSNDRKKTAPITGESALLEYLVAVGSAVPIPKALLSGPLKEKLGVAFNKVLGGGGGVSSIPKEIIVATLAVWLWAQHRGSFERAFARSGRIDVDPECKWLINAAIDVAVRAILSELIEGGSLSAVTGAGRSRAGLGVGIKQAASSTSSKCGESTTPSPTGKLDCRVATIVNEALQPVKIR